MGASKLQIDLKGATLELPADIASEYLSTLQKQLTHHYEVLALHNLPVAAFKKLLDANTSEAVVEALLKTGKTADNYYTIAHTTGLQGVHSYEPVRYLVQLEQELARRAKYGSRKEDMPTAQVKQNRDQALEKVGLLLEKLESTPELYRKAFASSFGLLIGSVDSTPTLSKKLIEKMLPIIAQDSGLLYDILKFGRGNNGEVVGGFYTLLGDAVTHKDASLVEKMLDALPPEKAKELLSYEKEYVYSRYRNPILGTHARMRDKPAVVSENMGGPHIDDCDFRNITYNVGIYTVPSMASGYPTLKTILEERLKKMGESHSEEIGLKQQAGGNNR